MAETGGKQMINSLTRGLIIMEMLMDRGSMGVTELGKALGVNKSSAYRLLSTLQERDFVEKDRVTGKYKLGMKLAHFRMKALDHLDIRDIGRPYLKKLTAMTREVSTLSILSEGHAVIIEKENSPQTISANVYVGMAEPLYCTALGKATLSTMPTPIQREILEGLSLKTYTSKTMIDIDQILSDIRLTATRGYAIDDEEYSLGMRCVAAAVRNRQGEAVAAIGVSGPIDRIRTQVLGELGELVMAVAQEFSEQMTM